MRPDLSLVADVVTTSLARTIAPTDFIGVGLGTPLALVAALVGRQLADGVHVLAGGAFDVDGDIDVWMGGPDATRGRTAAYVPHLHSMDMAERQTMTLQFLRPAQIDGRSALNTSRIGARRRPEVRFPGGLATADVPQLLPRVVAYLPHHVSRNLPDRVSFVTASEGKGAGPRCAVTGVTTLVTDLAVIDFSGKVPAIVSVHPWTTPEVVAENTAFPFTMDDKVAITPLPRDDENAALDAVDPGRRREVEIRLRGYRSRVR